MKDIWGPKVGDHRSRGEEFSKMSLKIKAFDKANNTVLLAQDSITFTSLRLLTKK